MVIQQFPKKDIMTYIEWIYEDDFYNFPVDKYDNVYHIVLDEIDCYYGLYQEDELVGIYEFHEKDGEMEVGIALNPKYCNQGFGREFLYLGLEYARKQLHFQGIFTLEVASHNSKAIHLYESMGFVYHSSRETVSYGRDVTFLLYKKAKIENIIFDNGNVLTTFAPRYMIDQYFDEDQELIQKVVFGQLWNDLDQGIIEEKDALEIFKNNLPVKYHLSLEKMFKEWHIYLKPKEDMYQYMLEIRDRYGFYLLSNAGVRHLVFQEFIPALKLMDGMVVSYEIKVNKPDPLIYQTLLQKYTLDPSKCIMIDDKEENIEEARNQGMFGFIYHNNLEELKQYMKYMGV